MKVEDLNTDAIKEHILIEENDGFDRETVSSIYIGYTYTLDGNVSDDKKKVIMVEGISKLFGGYKTWITFSEYRNILREWNLNQLV
jgi:hypothetical protein